MTWDGPDRVATEFEDALNRGERPPIRKELERVESGDRARLLAELVGLEIVHRRRGGETVGLTDYEPDFPELRDLAPAQRAELADWIERSLQNESIQRPSQIGRYSIVEELPGGGQAQVFRAIHPVLKTMVVLKLTREKPPAGALDRIGREGRLLSSLPPHRHLVRVFDVDFHEGRMFLVLEDVPGTTLEQYARNRPLDPRWAARTVAASARAVHVAHDLGITHQDLSPRNILIDRDGQPRVIDFGMAWHRPWWAEADDTNPMGGTLHYLAPEQAWGQADQIGRATDVFGLGGILYLLLAESPLYPGNQKLTLLQQARELDFDRSRLNRPGVPSRLRAICLKALAKEPAGRFATAADLAESLERYATPRPWGYLALLAALFLLSFGLAWSIWARRTASTVPPPSREPALQVRIWRKGTDFRPLLQALPIHTGDQVQVRWRVPKGARASLFLINSEGILRPVQEFPAGESDRDIVYPGPGKSQDVNGQPGTEMILALAHTGDLAPDAVSRLWRAESGEPTWPALPESTVVHLLTESVEIEGERSRDLGAIHDHSDPQERIRQRLDRLRERLKQSCIFFEGLAFAHDSAIDGGSPEDAGPDQQAPVRPSRSTNQ
jgi:serine/threonine protein kinase